MDIYSATEEAYKRGYEDGKRDSVTHGYWVEHKYAEVHGNRIISNYECSECNEWLRDDSNYCPNCGTKMDLED